MARPATDPAKVAHGLTLVQGGESAEEAARIAGISLSVLKRAQRAERAAPPPATVTTRRRAPKPAPTPVAVKRDTAATPARSHAPAPDPAEAVPTPLPPIDTDGDPLDIARAMLAANMAQVATLKADSPRLNPARAEGRALLKLVAALETERGALPTPEEVERRRRREDAETLKEIEQYVRQAERDAAAKGVCVHCGQAVAR